MSQSRIQVEKLNIWLRLFEIENYIKVHQVGLKLSKEKVISR